MGNAVLPPGDLVVYDLEFTTWEGAHDANWSAPGQFREIVQIGAVRIERSSGRELSALNLIVKPALNPVVSAYFTDLTGITQQRIEAEGLSFPEAMAQFARFCPGDGPVVSNGTDPLTLGENCGLHRMVCPIRPPRLLDVTLVVRRAVGKDRHVVTSTLGEWLGGGNDGSAHDALDDARLVARALIKIGI